MPDGPPYQHPGYGWGRDNQLVTRRLPCAAPRREKVQSRREVCAFITKLQQQDSKNSTVPSDLV